MNPRSPLPSRQPLRSLQTLPQALRPAIPARPVIATALACAGILSLGFGLGGTVTGAQAQVNPLSAIKSLPPLLKTYGAGGTNSSLDILGRPTTDTQARVRALATQPWMPADTRNAILTAMNFTAGTSKGGPGLVQGGPAIQQFAWPTVSGECIGGVADSVGSAIAVPGPTTIPAPGAGPGETVFLFTALGTTPAAPEQEAMRVQWFNIDTAASGITPLHNNGINPQGPTTVSGRAATGKGTVIAVLSGTVNTTTARCTFAPTAVIMEVH